MSDMTITPIPMEAVKILVEKPPVYEAVRAAFGIDPITAIFTYGDKIYNPANHTMRPDLIEHEKVHMRQQEYSDTGAALWWGKFLRDPEFRLQQEAEAYGRQYQFICATQSRQFRRKTLKSLGKILSGKLYNNMIGLEEAMELIKHYAKATL